jgi:hypothetical protein
VAISCSAVTRSCSRSCTSRTLCLLGPPKATAKFSQLQYTPKGLVILRYIAAPITFLGIAALVVSGGHYTMDVLIAYWLTR